jgi:F0F1-type ATP synthase membrane subunit b/b'
MDTTQREALIAMVAVLGLFLFMTLPALIGIARERRIDRQIERAEAARAAAGHHEGPTAARPATGAAPHRPARAA